MNRIGLIAASISLIATTATHAQSITGIQNHAVQELFILKPCAAAIKTIDDPVPNGIGVSEMAMAFGFIMGFEASHPNIKGDHETILTRLRNDCRTSGSKSAMQLLESYVQ